MRRSIQVRNNSYVVDYPDKCPICHHYGNMAFYKAGILGNNKVEAIFQCPYPECQCHFIGIYERFQSPNLEKLIPSLPQPNIFPDLVAKISPSFLEIYKEAEQAQYLGLNQIAGPGFRKAFEFLIKDYAKSTSGPEKYPKIDTAYSSQVIENYVQDKRIQAVAKRALWLGNDETHYLRKWIDKDISDLLTLIRLTVDWMDIEHSSNEYIKTMA